MVLLHCVSKRLRVCVCVVSYNGGLDWLSYRVGKDVGEATNCELWSHLGLTRVENRRAWTTYFVERRRALAISS